MKKVIGVLVFSLMVVGVGTAVYASERGCGGWFEPRCSSVADEAKTAAQIQEQLINAVPVPQLQTSLERINVAKRAQIFNDEAKVSYIYLVNYGKVMAFFTVKGKVSSLRSYMVPNQKLVREGTRDCYWESPVGSCYTIDAPDIDGTYGENVEGIFFFTTEGAYVEWRGDYMMSDQPLKLATPPELVRNIQ